MEMVVMNQVRFNSNFISKCPERRPKKNVKKKKTEQVKKKILPESFKFLGSAIRFMKGQPLPVGRWGIIQYSKFCAGIETRGKILRFLISV